MDPFVAAATVIPLLSDTVALVFLAIFLFFILFYFNGVYPEILTILTNCILESGIILLILVTLAYALTKENAY
jgi:hypothetical protein